MATSPRRKTSPRGRVIRENKRLTRDRKIFGILRRSVALAEHMHQVVDEPVEPLSVFFGKQELPWDLTPFPIGVQQAGYECIKAFSETDFTEDLKSIEVPVLVIHSEDDQIVPYADSGPLTVKLLKNGRLITYKDLPHGCCQTHPELVNADILAFLREEGTEAAQAETASEMA